MYMTLHLTDIYCVNVCGDTVTISRRTFAQYKVHPMHCKHYNLEQLTNLRKLSLLSTTGRE